MLYNFRITHAETDSRSGQTVCFGKGIKLYANLFRARKTKEASTVSSIKDQFTVGVVVKNNDVVFLRERDQFLQTD